MRAMQNILSFAKKPFTNLSPNQRRLSALRIGSSLVALFIIIIIFALQGIPSSLYVARINCAHLDVATGLYRSLGSSMTASVIDKGASNNVLPIDSGLSDSEISILTKYAQTQVSNAPQSFIMGSKLWCAINYATDFSDLNNVMTDMTTHCRNYDHFNFYDYRALLYSNQLEVILAYAYESNNAQNAAYRERVDARYHRFRVMRIIFAIQLAHQLVLLSAGLLIYGSRNGSQDLSSTSKLTLNIVAVVALTSGFTMIVSVATVMGDLASMKKEIHMGLGDFGISMTTGGLFISLVWVSLGAVCLAMVSWVIPLWCSNPKDDIYDLDEGVYQVRNGAIQNTRNTFTAKPYHLNRQNQSTRTSSRLFDHPEDSMDLTESTFDEEKIQDSSSFNEMSSEDRGPVESTSKTHSEYELRKLGEKLSRKLSVRQLNGPRRQKRLPEHLLLHKKDTRDLLYGSNPLSNHQYPQAFAKPIDSRSISRAASLTYDTRPVTSIRTRHLSEEKNWQYSKPAANHAELEDSFADDNHSVLDEAEMEYLDNNRFMNHLSK